jgi:ATP-dependent DNA helicase RecG
MSDRIFISSVQKELAEERRAIRDFVRGDALLRRFSDVFLFEDLPASDRRADEVYLDEVGRCPIYVGLFGQEYGYEDATGLSPTEREFDRATALGKTRFIYVKGADDRGRHSKMRALINKAGAQLIRRRFTGIADLTATLYASLVEHLERTGRLRIRPFDAAACPDATLADIAEDKVKWLLGIAGRERQYPLREDTPPAEALAHLNLLDAGQPTHAAVLLFGRQPQRFLLTSEVKCMHFHGTEVGKPIPSYQIYKGTVFELVDQAVDFVMSKITRAVGTRALGTQVPVEYELPAKPLLKPSSTPSPIATTPATPVCRSCSLPIVSKFGIPESFRRHLHPSLCVRRTLPSLATRSSLTRCFWPAMPKKPAAVSST